MKKITLMVLLQMLVTSINAKEVYATFTVHARQTANLAFRYSGIIKEINVDIMSEVKKGDILSTLISDDLIATNNASKVTLKYAQLDYERYKELLNKKLVDKSLTDYSRETVFQNIHSFINQRIRDRQSRQEPYNISTDATGECDQSVFISLNQNSFGHIGIRLINIPLFHEFNGHHRTMTGSDFTNDGRILFL